MKPLHGSSRALIEAARPAERPSEADRARVRARVMTKIAAGGAAATVLGAAGEAAGKGALAASAGAGAAGAGAAGLGLTKAIVAGTIAGLFVVSAAEITRAPSSPREARPAPTASVITTAAAPQRALPPPAFEGPRPAASAVEPRAPAPAPRASASAGLRDEVEILKEAQRAIAAGEPDKAVSLLDAHADRFKGGALTEERLAARAIALCEAGKGPAAKQAFRRFLAEAKASPLEARVLKACAGVADEP